MITLKNHPQRGTFSIRINDRTEIADRNLVDLLFSKNEKGRRLDQSAKSIYKEFNEIIIESKNNIKINKFNRLIQRHKDIFAELGIITKPNIIVVLDHYEFLPTGLIINYNKQNKTISNEDPNIMMDSSWI